jgi:hypothetical protein
LTPLALHAGSLSHSRPPLFLGSHGFDRLREAIHGFVNIWSATAAYRKLDAHRKIFTLTALVSDKLESQCAQGD